MLVLLSIVLTGREKMREEERELLTEFHLLFHSSYIKHAQNNAHHNNDPNKCLDANARRDPLADSIPVRPRMARNASGSPPACK
jgi:hypothetical protein